MSFILASSSNYRQSLLQKLRIPFIAKSPNIDETAQIGETAEDLVARLAEQKALAVATHTIAEDVWIIASDQVACYKGEIIGKSHTKEKAIEQLNLFSGETVTFLTSLCILHPATNRSAVEVEPFDVSFRQLSSQLIEQYLDLEQPYDCAGSFKSEGLGIFLFEALNGRDPNSLVGLPLILLQELFSQFDIELLDYSK